jgi:hypothetical protein
MENHALDAFKYFINGVAFMPGKLDPVVPQSGLKADTITVNGNWVHESYMDDEDLEQENYCHPEVKEAINNVLYSN